MGYTIYALTEDGTLNTIRYVGQTNKMKGLVARHMARAPLGRPRDQWIAELKQQGRRPVAVQLSSVVGTQQAAYTAEAEHIRQWTHYTGGCILNIDRRDPPVTPDDRKASVAEFMDVARWAIRQCIDRGLIDQPRDDRGWGRLLTPDKCKRRLARHAAHLALDEIAARRLATTTPSPTTTKG
jgi:hypothetical protein